MEHQDRVRSLRGKKYSVKLLIIKTLMATWGLLGTTVDQQSPLPACAEIDPQTRGEIRTERLVLPLLSERASRDSGVLRCYTPIRSGQRGENHRRVELTWP